MSLSEVGEALERWASAGVRAGTATLVRVRRSAPRPPGARFAVSEGGEVAGSVSSGCVEGDLHEHILAVLEEGTPRLVEYGITDEMAAGVGLSCGGEIEVLVAPHDPEDRAWREAVRLDGAGSAGVLFTGLADPVRGRRLLVRPDGARTGGLGDPALDAGAADAATRLLGVEGARIVEVTAPGGQPVQLFAESLLPPPRLTIVGATPVAAALCRMASQVGYAVEVVDPREAFARPERFPDARAVRAEWPEEALAAPPLDAWTDVVVLAHDAKLDVPALAAALRAGCRYVGQIGGGRTQRLRREALSTQGFSPGELERIRGPVGLDIGAGSPEEIAVSILAELIAVRRGRATG